MGINIFNSGLSTTGLVYMYFIYLITVFRQCLLEGQESHISVIYLRLSAGIFLT